MIADLEAREFYTRLNQVLFPSCPIKSEEMLFGRGKDMANIEAALYAFGRHAFIYGDRGVGKTSLAHTMAYKLQEEADPIFVGCEPDSTMASIIQDVITNGSSKSLDKKERQFKAKIGVSGTGIEYQKTTRDSEHTTKVVDVSSAVNALFSLEQHHSKTPFVVIDEFDQIACDKERQKFGMLIKNMGDQGCATKFIFTGIGDSLMSLIGGHKSSERQIHQTKLDNLSWDGREDIILKAFNEFGVTIDKDTRLKISGLSDGYPHYVHLMCEKILQGAYAKQTPITSVSKELFLEGLSEAVNSVSETLKRDYVMATEGRDDIYHHLLWAMADSADLQRHKAAIITSHAAICKHLNMDPLDKKQFDRRFNNLKKPNYGAIVIPALGNRPMWYRFKENMLRGYVRMFAESNGVTLDFYRQYTAMEPSVRTPIGRQRNYQPLTAVERQVSLGRNTKTS